MGEQLRWTIQETIRRYPEPDLVIHHLPDGGGDGEFQPVKCGGGINLPGHAQKVPLSEVCDDCRRGVVTM
ncbi:hypothetical protein [Agromyces humi]|uniref:hypothetical protein n=1 Tax=Agromyces humi TaxID=1766800 RepID=UPI00135BFCD0|nr:hypothetical protein [Agromyces humi]